MIKKELEHDAKNYGDNRRAPIVLRKEAQVMSEIEKQPTEAVTIILSSKGWVRCAKGHEMDPLSLSYKTGDEFKIAVKGKSDQPVVFMDSTGRAYTLNASSLPSARGQGEPLTGKVNPPAGSNFESVIIGEATDRFLVLSNAGYGFLVPFVELLGKNRNGKTILKVKEGQSLLNTIQIPAEFNTASGFLALISDEGRLLITQFSSIPEMTKGKGHKIMGVGKGAKVHEFALLSPKQTLTLAAGRKILELTPKEWKSYVAENGHRGTKLPKGYEKVVIKPNDSK